MFVDEPITENELTADQVRKGDVVAIVGPWDFHRHYGGSYRGRKDPETDVYYYEIWTVAACGKQLARLTSETGNLKRNIYVMNRDGRRAFVEFICKPDQVADLVKHLHSTDRAAKPNYKVFSRETAPMDMDN